MGSFGGGGDFYGGHAGGPGGGYAHVGVFEDEALGGGDSEELGGSEEGLGVGLGVGVVAGADEGGKILGEVEGLEGGCDGLAGAAGDYGEWDGSVGGEDVLEDVGNGLELGEEVEVEVLFVGGEVGYGEVDLLVAGEVVEDVGYRDGRPRRRRACSGKVQP